MQDNLLPENGTVLQNAPNSEAAPCPAPEAEKPKSGMPAKADLIFAAAFWFIGWLYAEFMGGIFGKGFYSVIFAVLYAACVLLYLKIKEIKPSKESLFWLSLLLIASASKAVFINNSYALITALFIHCTAIYWTLSAANALTRFKTSALLLLDALYGAVIFPFSKLHFWLYCLICIPKSFFGKMKRKELSAVFLGALLGVIMLFIVVPQLAGADYLFEGLVGNLFNFLPSGAIVSKLIFGALVSSFLFGLMFASANSPSPRQNSESIAKKTKFLPHTSAAVLFFMLSGVYIVFLITITMQLFPAFSGFLPSGASYSQYAREGFFELCRVCSITIAAMSLAFGCAKNDWRESRAVKVSALLLCASSVGLCITALMRLMLYIGAYGLTGLRLITSLFTVFLALLFIMAAVCIVKPFNVVRAAFLTFCAGFTLLLCVNTSALIESYNLSRVEKGTLKSTDFYSYFESSPDTLHVLINFAETTKSTKLKEMAQDKIHYVTSSYGFGLESNFLIGRTVMELIYIL